jgi:Pyridoxamine 5'-phosphate oxidase
MVESFLREFLRRHPYGVVSSIAPDGTPQSAIVGIATSDELEIVFDTLSTSRKYRNLMARPECSFVVGSGEQTLQFEGTARKLEGAALAMLQNVYFAAWPDGPTRMHVLDVAYIAVRPHWIRYSDYDRRPPLIEETTFKKEIEAGTNARP